MTFKDFSVGTTEFKYSHKHYELPYYKVTRGNDSIGIVIKGESEGIEGKDDFTYYLWAQEEYIDYLLGQEDIVTDNDIESNIDVWRLWVTLHDLAPTLKEAAALFQKLLSGINTDEYKASPGNFRQGEIYVYRKDGVVSAIKMTVQKDHGDRFTDFSHTHFLKG